MSETKEKKYTRLTPRIHRRKNVQIPKEYFCTVSSCGKGYGSYAALYTHMKNKHTNIKPPNMPSGNKVKNAPQGRPKVKKNQGEKIQEERVYCKICMEVECKCIQDFNSDEKNKTLEIMSSQKFINFVSEVGAMTGLFEFSWVRRTDEDYNFKTHQKLAEDIQKFKSQFNIELVISEKLLQFMSFSSKYWNPEHIDELYKVIYAIIGFENYNLTNTFFKEHAHQFQHIRGCIELNEQTFQRFETLIRII